VNSLRGSRRVAACLIAVSATAGASLATTSAAGASTTVRASTAVRTSNTALTGTSPRTSGAASRLPSVAQLIQAHAKLGQAGEITGSVAGFDGQPVTGACVTAAGDGRSVTTTASPGGTFRLAGLPAGSYALEYRDCAAAGRYLTGEPSTAARVQVAAGQVRHVPVMTLRPVNPVAALDARQASFRRGLAASNRKLSAAAATKTGQMSGKVTGRGKPLSGICIIVTAVAGPQTYDIQTAKDGRYTVRGVAPGRYYVMFDPTGVCPSRANWLQQVYKNDNNPFAPPAGRATAVRVRRGGKVSGINADLRLGGAISGTVTGKSGAKLRGICVMADADEGHGLFVNYGARTAANGSYHLHALFAGKYSLHFEIGCGSGDANYAPANRDSVGVALGQNRAVDQMLAAGASISGRVTLGSSSGSPLSGICVDASNASGLVGGFTATGRGGDYRVIGLTGGRFQLDFAPDCNNSGNYTSVSLTARTTAGRQTSDVNAVLQIGATISGTITDPHGSPVSGMCIEVDSNNTTNANVGDDNSGSYVINELSAGTYQVGFYDGCGNSGNYAPNWYAGQPSQSTATPITLATGAVDNAANAVLEPGVTISGKVTNTAGNAVSGACVGATTLSDALYGPVLQAQTNRHGAYAISGLAPGQYLIDFGCGLQSRYGDQWFPDAPDDAAARLVSARAGRTSGINAVLQQGGTIRGLVTGEGGRPLGGVCVLATNTAGTPPVLPGISGEIASILESDIAFTGSRGAYQLSGLAAGNYQVSFALCGGDRYAEQWYRGKVAAQAATAVRVRAGKSTPGIDGRLVFGSTISGRVINRAGNPLRNICVQAAAASGGPVASAITSRAGTYTIRALASGRYSVEFEPCGSQNLITALTRVRVIAPHVKTGVNATLRPGGSISGAVTASSAQPVSDSCVEAYRTGSAALAGFSYTDLDGSYLMTGLTAGSYQVYFGDPRCVFAAPGLAPQWDGSQSAQADATPVSVTVGATTGPVDAALQPDGEITGTVSVAGSPATPLSGACVTAFRVSGAQQAGLSAAVVAVSGPGGYTLADLLPGRYRVRFSAGCGATGYATQWYQDMPSRTAATVITVTPAGTLTGISARFVMRALSGGLEDHEHLADRLVNVPGAGPAAREERGVTRTDLKRLAAVRSDGHAAGQDVHELVLLLLPVGRASGAFPDADFLAVALPDVQTAGLHGLAGCLFERAPVLQLRGGGRGEIGGYVGHADVSFLTLFSRVGRVAAQDRVQLRTVSGCLAPAAHARGTAARSDRCRAGSCRPRRTDPVRGRRRPRRRRCRRVRRRPSRVRPPAPTSSRRHQRWRSSRQR
jgi:Carboxypeptidase regulatory-like domain